MNEIKNWILNINNSPKLSLNSCLFISGASGSGKSYIINKIANQLDLFIIHINSNNCSTSSQLNDFLTKSFVSSLIQILTNNNSKKIIIIDDFDVLLMLDNTINLSLYNFILNNTNKLKNIPIVVIINNETIKKIGEIKKRCKIIEINKLDEYDIYDILKSYNEKLELGEALKIIKDTDYNINDAIKILNNSKFNDKDDNINFNELYEITYNRSLIKKLLLKEPWIIPLNFHENLITELSNNRKGLKKDRDEFYKSFIMNFCLFDVFMAKNPDISLDLFVLMIKKIYDFPLKKNKGIKEKTNFTKMLSYLSLQKKNNKNAFKSSFPFSQIDNYHSTLSNRKFIY